MKILILNDGEDYGLGASYARAFRELGHQATLVDPLAELRKRVLWRFALTRRVFERQIIKAFNRKWIEELSRFPAELIWVGKGGWAVPWLWRELKRRKPEVNLVCYNGDNPIVTYSRGGNRPWVTDSIACFDLYCTYNRSLVEPLRRAGARQVERIPFGWDPGLHPELEVSESDQRQYACDVLFIGNGDVYRERWMREIIVAARPFGWRFAIYGNWSRCHDRTVLEAVRGTQIYGSEMVKAIRVAKVAVNILRLQNEGSHNMRTFEIPGCGGVMASQRSPEQEEFFPDGQAAVYFGNAVEAVARIRELIEQDSRRKRVALTAHEIASRHTYSQRASALLATVNRGVVADHTLLPP